MHSFAHHHHGESGEVQPGETRGLVMNWGWRYDLMVWFLDTVVLRGKLQALRHRTADLAQLQSGETVLDVGCGTGTLALVAKERVGATGRVFGIDPGPKQIARASAKAARYGLPIDFQVGVIEQLAFPDQSFDAVLSTLMMHHLPDDLKRQGLSEIARVLKPGGRLAICFCPLAPEPLPWYLIIRCIVCFAKGDRNASPINHSPVYLKYTRSANVFIQEGHIRQCPCKL